MKKLSIYFLITVLLIGICGSVSSVNAADPVGTCKLKAKIGGAIVELKGDTESNCRKMADDPANAAIFVSWTANPIVPAGPLGTCKLKAKTGGAVIELPGNTEQDCRRMADDPANAAIFVSWTANPTAPPPNVPIGNCTEESTKQVFTDITEAACKAKGASWVWASHYYFLAPLPCQKGSENCVNGRFEFFDPTNAGGGNSNFGRYLNIIIKIFIGICAVLAVMMIVVGGLEYMTSDLVSSKESGKHKISGAIFGLVLALGSWTLLNQINPNLLNADLKNLEEITVQVDLEADIPQTPKNGKYLNGTSVGSDWATVSGMAPTPLPSWVGRNKGECQRVGDASCTSTRGLVGTYINAIHAGCNCSLILTGGTEFWLHGGKTGSTSHRPGSPTVDLRATPELTKYIAEGKKLVHFTRYEKGGISFLYEIHKGVAHWHVGR